MQRAQLRRQPLSAAPDAELVRRYQERREQPVFDELWTRHRPRVQQSCARYFLPGADNDDRDAEAAIGFMKAVRDYDPDQNVEFAVFATECARRQVLTALRGAQAHKTQLLTNSARLEMTDEHGNRLAEKIPMTTTVDAVVESRMSFGEIARSVGIAVSPDEMERLVQRVGSAPLTDLAREGLGGGTGSATTLSEAEMSVLLAKVSGTSYSEMASELGKSVKYVDNALQRVKVKLRQAMTRSDVA